MLRGDQTSAAVGQRLLDDQRKLLGKALGAELSGLGHAVFVLKDVGIKSVECPAERSWIRSIEEDSCLSLNHGFNQAAGPERDYWPARSLRLNGRDSKLLGRSHNQ